MIIPIISMALQPFTNQHPLKPFQLSLVNNPLSALAKDNRIINQHPYLFNHEITNKLPITDQKSSGRCWLFATLNLVRSVAYENWKSDFDIQDLEFSQTYNYFCDKFERYHRSLRYFIQINKQPNNTHYLIQLYKDPLGDGGQWDMAREIIKKYGIVPKSAMPDTYHSKSSAGMNKILTEQLKQDMLTLSVIDEEFHNQFINNMMEKMYDLLVGFLGVPPLHFDYMFKIKDKSKDQVITWSNLNPLILLEKTKFNPDDWISIVDDPRKENPYNKYYQVKYLGNVLDQHVGWLNLPIERLKELTKKSIDNNEPVWFGCDVGAHIDRDTGIHHPNIINLELFMNHTILMSKEDRLRMYQSLPSHAMLIVGYHENEDNKIVRWKIENSWGKTSGTDGFQLMTDEWFTEYVFQVIIHRSNLINTELELLNTPPSMIEPWDPLGTLA
jgi:bleomycin hydrolase